MSLNRRIDQLEEKAKQKNGRLHKLTIRFEIPGQERETVQYAPDLKEDTTIVVKERHDYLGENHE